MKRHLLLAAGIALGPAIAACGHVTHAGTSAAGIAKPVTPPAARPMSHSVASSTVWFDCTRHGLVEPTDYILTCADAGSVLGHLRWQSWGAQRAVATGVHELNSCTPNCAAGKFIDYPVVVTLWRSEPASGQRYFTRITVRYTGSRPPAYTSMGHLIRQPAQWTQPLSPSGA